MSNRKKPKILDIKPLAKTRLFNIQKLKLQFSNKEVRYYERHKGLGIGAVLIIPMIDKDNVLMIYEYGCGTEKYELCLPKGKIDAGEDIFTAANREIQEEIGYGANKFTHLKTITLSPGYFSSSTEIILAQDLYPKTAIGDEPEPLEVVKHKLSDINNLIKNQDLTEARSIVALFLAKAYIDENT